MTEYSGEPRLITLTYVLKHTGRTARGGGTQQRGRQRGKMCPRDGRAKSNWRARNENEEDGRGESGEED